MTSCELRAPPQTSDIPHTQLGALQRYFTVDLAGCNLYVIAQAMNEFDRAKTFTLRFESWPADIQAIFNREMAGWEERNPTRAIRAYTISVAEQTFSVALHWRPKFSGAAA